MKTLRLLFIFTAAVLISVSCDKQPNMIDELGLKKTTYYTLDAWNSIDFCEIETHDLIAGQTINVGTVTVGNDGDSLYVKYEVDEGYLLAETHLFAGDVMSDDFPKGKKDNPKIGQFPYASEVSSNVVIYSIDLDELEDCFEIAAHAVVMSEDGTFEETAWGAGGEETNAVLAAKVFVNDSDYGLTDGVRFVEDCSWAWWWGYIPLDIDNFTSGNYNVYSSSGVVYAKVNLSIDGDNLVVNFVPENGNILNEVDLFIGTVDELMSFVGSDGCTDYRPGFDYKSAYVEIPLSDLPTAESNDANDLAATRWGFYFDYCVGSCD